MAQLLPDLPLIEIFKHLGLVDLTRARAVSRRWRALIDGCVRIEELATCSTKISNPKNWFHYGKRIRRESWLKLDVLDRDFSKFNRKIARLHLLASLKRLRVYRPDTEMLRAYYYNRLFTRLAIYFTALEHLEIDFHFNRCDGCDIELIHPNLKVLRFAPIYSELRLVIDCPQLEALQFDQPFDECTISYPETIKQLYYYHFRGPASSSDLEVFANVELYVCDVSLNGLDIWSMPKLKELRMENFYGWSKVIVRAGLTRLIEKKERLGSARSCAKIYYEDKECSVNLKESHPYLFSDDE